MLFQLRAWNMGANFGKVYGLTVGVHLPAGGDYIPDTFVVATAAWEALPSDARKDYVPARPDAVFELLSPENKTATGFTAEFQKKLDDYDGSAVPLVVLLDPASRSTTVRRPRREDVITFDAIVSFRELPGLSLDVAALFDAST